MKFYVFEATTYNDGTKDAVGIYTYDNLNAAKSVYHTKMGGAMKNANIASELLVVMDDCGAEYEVEKHTADVTA